MSLSENPKNHVVRSIPAREAYQEGPKPMPPNVALGSTGGTQSFYNLRQSRSDAPTVFFQPYKGKDGFRHQNLGGDSQSRRKILGRF